MARPPGPPIQSVSSVGLLVVGSLGPGVCGADAMQAGQDLPWVVQPQPRAYLSRAGLVGQRLCPS